MTVMGQTRKSGRAIGKSVLHLNNGHRQPGLLGTKNAKAEIAKSFDDLVSEREYRARSRW